MYHNTRKHILEITLIFLVFFSITFIINISNNKLPKRETGNTLNPGESNPENIPAIVRGNRPLEIRSGRIKDVARRISESRENYWNGRAEWEANFPFTPQKTTKNLTFDKFRFEDLKSQWEASGDLDSDEWEYINIISEHAFIVDFYESPTRLTKGFADVFGFLRSKGYGRTIEEVTAVYDSLKEYLTVSNRDPQNIPENDIVFDGLTRLELAWKVLQGALSYSGLEKEGISNSRYSYEKSHEIAKELLDSVSAKDFEGVEGYGYPLFDSKGLEDGELLLEDVPLPSLTD